MAIDFLIFVLLLISFIINTLALGAFWVTPALRTTANRFVINLLIVNIVGSLILAPTLFLSSYYEGSRDSDWKENHLAVGSRSQIIVEGEPSLPSSQNHLTKHDSIIDAEFRFNPVQNSYNIDNSKRAAQFPLIEEDVDITVNGTQKTRTHSQCNGSECETIIIQTDSERDKILIAEIDEKEEDSASNAYSVNPNRNKPYRCWSIDLAAALGALSVLLVVGDTWCAVTDPLRYHARISGLKAWLLIATIWFCGILFGVLSALRDNVFPTNDHEVTEEMIEYKDSIQAGNNRIFDEKIMTRQYEDRLVSLQPNDLYNMIYSTFYFIVIILLPFGFVCGMYWRIFSEARENGLRMRQNGSSPLLQSALNLSAHQSHAHQQNVQMAREQRESSTNSASGLTMKIDETASPLLVTVPVHKPKIIKEDRNQNVVLALSQSEEVRRNQSANHLSSLDSPQNLEEEVSRKNSMRHVHSTPNLNCNPHHHGSFSSTSDHPHHIFHLPSVHVPPKALSYVTSIRHRLSNASSLFKYREESRAARISILVVIMFLISYLPFGLLILLQSRLSNLIIDSTQFAIFMVLLANLSSPFIFAYRNKRVRRGVKKIFGLDSKSRERQLFRGTGGRFFRCGTKASIQVRRSASKASTYSVNSCKYLTPHAVNNGTFLMEIEKCHYMKNSSQKQLKSLADQVSLSGDVERRSILKRVCDSSRKLGCASNSCTTSDNEQTDV